MNTTNANGFELCRKAEILIGSLEEEKVQVYARCLCLNAEIQTIVKTHCECRVLLAKTHEKLERVLDELAARQTFRLLHPMLLNRVNVLDEPLECRCSERILDNKCVQGN
jgi:hypothetical protein